MQDYVDVKKGDYIGVLNAVVNHASEFWGDDAHDFRPERWEETKTLEQTSGIPGAYAHTMTFLGGTRACIGYRFSIAEYVDSTPSARVCASDQLMHHPG
jgi:cytochrome P450